MSRRSMSCFAATMVLFAASSVLAQSHGHYALERGKGVAVCEAYEQNLIAVDPNPVNHARMCPIPIEAAREGFEPIEWLDGRYKSVPMPVPVGVDIYSKIDGYIWQRGVNPAAYVYLPNASAWQGTPRQIEDAHRQFLRISENAHSVPSNRDSYVVVDVDNDGTAEPIYHDGRYCYYGGLGALLIVLTPDYANIDRARTDLLMAHPPRAKQAPVFRPKSEQVADDALRQSRYDLFRFRKRTYITQWGFEEPNLRLLEPPPLHVHVVEKGRNREICTYRYTPPPAR
jgi:hypothetical protein